MSAHRIITANETELIGGIEVWSDGSMRLNDEIVDKEQLMTLMAGIMAAIRFAENTKHNGGSNEG